MNIFHCLTLSAALTLAAPALAQQSFGQPAPAYPEPSQQAQPTTQGMQQPNMGAMQQPNVGTMQAPQMGGMQQPNMGGMQQPGMGGGNPMMALLQAEMQDFGVPARSSLQETFHAPTPTSIPGGQTITTDRLLALYQQMQQNGLLVFDVLGSGQTLPMAQNAVGAAQPGSFNDQTQSEFGNYLQQVTQGNKNRPMVFYCQGTYCWMSYNAALRAINLGFTQVYWYRGGVEAWQQAQQLAASMPQQPQQGAGYPGMGGQNTQPMQPAAQPGGW